MKKYILAFVGMLAIALPGFSQSGFYINAGYNGSYFTSKKVNEILNRFNAENDHVVQPFSPFGYMDGAALGMGFRTKSGLTVNIDYAGRQAKSDVVYTLPGYGNITRDLKFDVNTVSFTFGAFPRVGDGIAFGAGMCIDVGETKIAATPEVLPGGQAPFYKVIQKDNYLGFSPMVQLFLGLSPNVFLGTRVYYQYNATVVTFMPLVEELITPLTEWDTEIMHEGKMNNFGISISLTYSIGQGGC